MKQRLENNRIAVLLCITYLISTTLSSPVFLNQFHSGGVGRNIRHLPCVSRKTGETGVCMFAFTCAKANGTHLGTCIDRFYFGSCCKIEDEPGIFPQDNTIEDNNSLSYKPFSSSSLSPSLVLSTTTDSNDIPGNVDNVDKQKPVVTLRKPSTPSSSSSVLTTKLSSSLPTTTTGSTTMSPIMSTISKITEIMKTKPAQKIATKKPLVETTTPSIKLTTFQSVDNATVKTEPSTSSSSPSSSSSKRPHRPEITKPRPRPTISSTKPSSSSTKPSSTLETSTSSIFIKTQNSTYSSTLATSTSTNFQKIETTQNVPSSTEESVKPSLSTSSAQKFSALTRFPPRNVTTQLPPTTTAPPAKTTSSETRRPTGGTRKPTKRPPYSTRRPGTTTKKPTSATTVSQKTSSTSVTNATATTVPVTKFATTTQVPLTTITSKTPATTTTTATTSPSPSSTTKNITSTATYLYNYTLPSSTLQYIQTSSPTTSQKVTSEKPLPRPSSKPVSTTTTTTTQQVTSTTPVTTKFSTTFDILSDIDNEISATTLAPGITTWNSVSSFFTTETATKLSSIANVTENTSTLSTSDDWIKIQSPTTEPSTSQKPSSTTQKPTSTTQKPSTTTSRPFVSVKPIVQNETTTKESVTDYSTVTVPITTMETTPSTTTERTSVNDLMSILATAMPDIEEEDVPPLNMTNYRDVCGRRMYPEPRIVGGNGSTFGKWPWQISLRQWRTSTYLHKCGAALLNENWAITAAHCVQNVLPSDLLLRIGEYDLGNDEEPFGFQERRVQIVATHPNFDPRTFEYDLALMRFYEPVLPFQPNILPVCVPNDDEDYVGQTAYVTGWGRLYEEGPLPSILQEVAVPVINNTVCEGMYKNAGYIEHIPHIFICAGWRKGGFDSCEGDSGGPLVVQRKRDKRWILVGVISWGIGCAEPNQPGVYTRISEFREWINQILQF